MKHGRVDGRWVADRRRVCRSPGTLSTASVVDVLVLLGAELARKFFTEQSHVTDDHPQWLFQIVRRNAITTRESGS